MTTRHDEFLECRTSILHALRAQMDKRDLKSESWIAAERSAMVYAANKWRGRHGPLKWISQEDVEHVETLAMGHVDYASKVSLYVAEMVYGFRPTRGPE